MPLYAGYAAAVTVRDQVFNDAVLSAYASGHLRHVLIRSFQQLPAPRGSVSLFFQSPRVLLSSLDHEHAILRIIGWGTVGLLVDPLAPSESRSVRWQADLRITPTADSIGTIALLSAKQGDHQLVGWQFDVLSGTGFSAAAHAYLSGDTFKGQMELWLKDTVGDLSFPIIDFSFLGPFGGTSFTGIAVRVVTGALILGFDMDDGSFATVGDPELLEDFAGGGDVAVIVNPHAIQPMMSFAHQLVQDAIQEHGATLDSPVSITCEEGRFRLAGRATKHLGPVSLGSADFSVAVVPRMTYGRSGAYIQLKKTTMAVRARSWPALSFVAVEPEVDIDRGWVVLFSEILLAHFIEPFISELARNITAGVPAGDLNPSGPPPRVRRIGDPPIRFKIEQFEIHATGVFIGITSRREAAPADVSGLRSIPRNFAGRTVRYQVRLPFGALPDDPFLRVRWAVIDLDSGSVLLTDDAYALNRLSIEFIPASLGAHVDRFAVVCRVYRALGPFATELLNQTIRLEVGPPLPPGAYVRWHYDVKNPVIALDGATDKYTYRGDRVVRRWSKYHRTDKPCKNAQTRSRYTYFDETLDDLPFPIKDISGNRHRLCDYCFYGGPASTISSL
jgi:hypothetical protein